MKINKIAVSLIAAGVMASPLAQATNGYFSHGYGMKAKGMAGVGIALPQDSLAAATNPAGIVMVGNRIDVGVDLFKPNRNTELTSLMGPAAGTYSGNGDSSFVIPEFGYNKMLGTDSAVGVAVYGNGGMNTKYTDFNTRTGGAMFGTGDLGVDLSQLFIAPTYARKLNPDNSIGISLNLAYQRFKAEGLQNFAMFSATPGSLSNNGYDSSTGWGVRIGWTGQITPAVSLGATYQTKTKMGKFSKYAGLFAEQGGFDIPANYGVGVAFKLDNSTTLAADVQTIQYSGVKSIANSGNVLQPLGSNGGPGFGWKDMTVLKFGASHKYDSNLEVRAGFSTGKQPIPDNETQFNVLAPGIVENHLTLGGTWTLANNGEVTVGYMHAFKKTVTGTGATAGFNLNMSEDSLGVAYGWKM
ncbi:MAG: outer membrane protein transport protein [Gallionella sp.]